MLLARHIRDSLEVPSQVVQAYLEDLTDAELLIRPAPGMNHIAWQLGHLIVSENAHINQVTGNRMPNLPEDFSARHSKATAAMEPPAGFLTRREYLALMQQQRTATLRLLDEFSDEDLQQPAPPAIRYFGPTVGCVFAGESMHWMMHAGQWAVVRRLLGRPPLF